MMVTGARARHDECRIWPRRSNRVKKSLSFGKPPQSGQTTGGTRSELELDNDFRHANTLDVREE
jgi:hypothetical protein